MKRIAVLSAPVLVLTVVVGVSAPPPAEARLTKKAAQQEVRWKALRLYWRIIEGRTVRAQCDRITARYFDCEYFVRRDGIDDIGDNSGGNKFVGTGSVRKPKGARKLVVRVSRPRPVD